MRRWSRSRRDLDDAVDHVHALYDFPEYAIAITFLSRKPEVEHGVVDDIDEELRRCRMRIGRARHGQRPNGILKVVVRFIANRAARWFLFEFRGESSALNHEAGNDPVENRAVIEAVLGVAQEVLDRLRRLVGIELDDNGTGIGLQFNLRIRREYQCGEEQSECKYNDSVEIHGRGDNVE